MFVQFVAGKNGDPIAFINRKVSFPPRGSQVQEGEWWEVEIEQEGERVNHLKLISNFSAKTEITGDKMYGSESICSSDGLDNNTSIHPVSTRYVRGYRVKSSDFIHCGDTWRYQIDHENMTLIPIERVENERDRVNAHAQTMLTLLKSLLPTEVGETLSSLMRMKRHDEPWICDIYGIYSAFKADASTLTEEICRDLVVENVQQWTEHVAERKAYYAAQPAYNGPDSGGLNFCHSFDEGDEW